LVSWNLPFLNMSLFFRTGVGGGSLFTPIRYLFQSLPKTGSWSTWMIGKRIGTFIKKH
jgi:hypothetical protein